MTTGALVPSETTNLAWSGPANPWCVDQLAELAELLVQHVLEVDVGLDVSRGPFRHRCTIRLDLAIVFQQHESHLFILPDSATLRCAAHPEVDAVDRILDITPKMV